MARILIAGESWITTSTHIKGVDEFSAHSYNEGVNQLRTALESSGHDVVHMPAHLVPEHFPHSREALSEFDVVVLSDIGANSLNLTRPVFEHAQRGSDRIGNLVDWVVAGGGFLMIGGYLSFSGFQARAAYQRTRLPEILPVTLLDGDDRVETPAGIVPVAVQPAHPVLSDVDDGPWPHLLGYNKTRPLPDSDVLATVGDDPLIAVRSVGAGRAAVFTSDCSPHWAPVEFCEDWPGYRGIFAGIVSWLTQKS